MARRNSKDVWQSRHRYSYRAIVLNITASGAVFDAQVLAGEVRRPLAPRRGVGRLGLAASLMLPVVLARAAVGLLNRGCGGHAPQREKYW
jgi:hypothetical protein